MVLEGPEEEIEAGSAEDRVDLVIEEVIEEVIEVVVEVVSEADEGAILSRDEFEWILPHRASNSAAFELFDRLQVARAS